MATAAGVGLNRDTSLASLPEEINVVEPCKEKELRRAPSESIPEELLFSFTTAAPVVAPATVPEALVEEESGVDPCTNVPKEDVVEEDFASLSARFLQAQVRLEAEKAATAKLRSSTSLKGISTTTSLKGPDVAGKETLRPLAGEAADDAAAAGKRPLSTASGKDSSQKYADGLAASWTSCSTTGPVGESGAQQLRKQLAEVEAEIASERAARQKLEVDLRQAKEDLSDARMDQMDTSYKANVLEDELRDAKEALQEAVMSRLDASYEKGEFQQQLDVAREELEVALMSQLDASYQADELKEELFAAREKLEDMFLDRLQASYEKGALREKVDAVKEELQHAVMSHMDASYRAEDFADRLHGAEEELEEAVMLQLEASYEEGGLRGQLEAAKEQLEQALQHRLDQSYKLRVMEAQLHKAEGEKAELEMQRLEDSYIQGYNAALKPLAADSEKPESIEKSSTNVEQEKPESIEKSRTSVEQEKPECIEKSRTNVEQEKPESIEKSRTNVEKALHTAEVTAVVAPKASDASPATATSATSAPTREEQTGMAEARPVAAAVAAAAVAAVVGSPPPATTASGSHAPSRRREVQPTSGQGGQNRPLGADAVIPVVRGQQRLRREAEQREQQESEAKAKALRLRDRLRSRYQEKHPHSGAAKRGMASQHSPHPQACPSREKGRRPRQPSPPPKGERAGRAAESRGTERGDSGGVWKQGSPGEASEPLPTKVPSRDLKDSGTGSRTSRKPLDEQSAPFEDLVTTLLPTAAPAASVSTSSSGATAHPATKGSTSASGGSDRSSVPLTHGSSVLRGVAGSMLMRPDSSGGFRG